MTYQSINPYNGKVFRTWSELNDAQLEHAIAVADSAFHPWKRLGYAERRAIVTRAATILRERADAFAQLETTEMGKLIGQARGEVRHSADILAYYAEHAERFLRNEALHPDHGEAHRESSPIGVIFGVKPWNFPYDQLARVAGNVVMVKHAACVPQCAIAFERLWIEAGAPTNIHTNRDDVHQRHRLVRRGAAVRRHQELGVRPRARRHGHPAVRQPEAGPHRRRPGAGLSAIDDRVGR